MTLHRPRRPYSPAHARRQLARVEAQIATWRATDCTGDWRRGADKHQALKVLEAARMRWLAVLAPPPVEQFRF